MLEEHYGWHYTEDGEVVVNQQEDEGTRNKLIENIEDTYPEISDYSTYFCFVRSRQKVIEGRAMLWNILSPLHFCGGDILLKKDTEVYHESEDEIYVPYELGMTQDEDGIPIPDVIFSTKDERHFRRWTGKEIENMFQEGKLKLKDNADDDT